LDRVGGRMMKTEPTLLSGLEGTLVWMKAAGIGVEGYATRRCFEIPYERWAPMCLLRDFGPSVLSNSCALAGSLRSRINSASCLSTPACVSRGASAGM